MDRAIMYWSYDMSNGLIKNHQIHFLPYSIVMRQSSSRCLITLTSFRLTPYFWVTISPISPNAHSSSESSVFADERYSPKSMSRISPKLKIILS